MDMKGNDCTAYIFTNFKNRIGYTSLNLFWIVHKRHIINNVFKH